MSREFLSAVTFLRHDSAWAPAAAPLAIMSLTGMLYASTNFATTVWLAKGRLRLGTWWSVTALLSIALAVAAGMPFGVMGVCVSLLIRAVVLFPVTLHICTRVFGMGKADYLRTLLPAMVSGAAMAAVCFGASRLANPQTATASLLTLLSGTVAGLILYVACLRTLFPTDLRSILSLVHELGKRESTADDRTIPPHCAETPPIV
jgi:hypothetical protein